MNKINWKVDILSTDIFKIERPHMSAFEDSNIQSAINTSLALLNAECNGLIEETWSVIDTDSPLFRTEREKSYIREAVISQTQFSLNMGLDMTDGSSSFSMGGINTSFQRPIEKKEVAPGVYILLQKARVYKLQSFTNNFVKSDTPIEECNVNKYLTPGQAEISYVKYDQSGTGAPIGGVLVVDNDKRATFKNPKEVEINSYNSLRIWDNGYGGTPNNPEDTVGSYKFINDVTNLAWFGDNTTNTLTRLQVQNLILASTLIWNAEIPYAKGTVIQYLYISTEGQKLLGSAVSKVSNNLGNNPTNDSGEHWEILATQPIDLDFVVSEVIKQLTDRNTPNGKSKLDKVVEEKLNELPTIDYVSEYKKPVLSFESEEDFSAYKLETGTTDSDYETISIPIDYYTKGETDTLLNEKESNLLQGSGIQFSTFNNQKVLSSFRYDKIIEVINWENDLDFNKEILTIELTGSEFGFRFFGHYYNDILGNISICSPIEIFDMSSTGTSDVIAEYNCVIQGSTTVVKILVSRIANKTFTITFPTINAINNLKLFKYV